jgi:hypothetical protein
MRHAAATIGRRAAGYFIAPPEQPTAEITRLVPRDHASPPAEIARLVPRDHASPPAELTRLIPRGHASPPADHPGVTPGLIPAPSSPAVRPAVPAPAAPSPPAVHPRAGTAPPAVTLPPRVAVLGRRAEAVAVAVAVANALRAQHGAPAAALALWSPLDAPRPDAEPEPRPPASPGASRLAARLSARGLTAVARGRLAWVGLDDHPVAAALAARRLAGAVDAPVVTVIAGPRTAVLEGLLREQDLLVVVARDPGGALARLAVATSEVPAVACPPLAAGPARLLAAAGLAGPRALDPRTRAALERLGEPVPPGLTTRAARR